MYIWGRNAVNHAAIKTTIIGASLLGLSACASVVSGTSRDITINTEPPAATCNLNRNGSQIGGAGPTPETVNVSRSKYDIDVTCQKPGYRNGSATIQSEFEPWTIGNIALGGLVGMIVDMSTGAIADYPSQATVRLSPAPGTAPQQPAQPQAAAPAAYYPAAQQSPNNAPYAQTAGADTSRYQACYGAGLSYSERLAKFGADIKRINEDADTAIADVRTGCMWGEPLEWLGNEDQGSCEARVAQIEARRNADIERLNQQWRGTYMN